MAKVLISTGEASGDSIGAALVSEMRILGFEGEFFAIGGKRLRESGCTMLCDSSHWGAIGIYQALIVAPRVMKDYYRLKSWLKRNKPQLVIAVDFGYFNVRFCRYAKKLGCKTLYFVPPGSWRRNKQGNDLPHIADKIATPFSWSAEILNAMGANAEWVGHPIYQMAQRNASSNRQYIAILPGSRQHEVANNLAAIAAAIDKTCLPVGVTPRIVAAPNISKEFLISEWSKHSTTPVSISTEPATVTLRASVAAVICSGTATLEAAICDCPMVVVYRINKMVELEYRIRKPKFDYISLPSILLGRKVVTELIHYYATPIAIVQELEFLLTDTEARRNQLIAFEQIRAMLGAPNGVTRTAEIAMELLNG